MSNRGEKIKVDKIQDLIPPKHWKWDRACDWKPLPSSEPRKYLEVIYEYRHMQENGKEHIFWKDKVNYTVIPSYMVESFNSACGGHVQ